MTARRGTIREVTLGLNGSPTYLGTIVATTTGVDNSNTGVTFTIPPGIGVYMETDSTVFWMPLTKGGNTPPATTAMVTLAGSSGIYFIMSDDKAAIVARTAAGTANLKVFALA